MTRTLRKKTVDKDVLTLATERMSRVMDMFDRTVVAFSGGKDSTVVLNVALAEAERRGETLEVVFWDEEAIHPETIEYVRRVYDHPRVSMRWLCWPVKHRNACSRESPWWYPWAPEKRDVWCRGMPSMADGQFPAGWEDAKNRRTIPDSKVFLFPQSQGSVGLVMGIRAAESLRRYRSVTAREQDNWMSPATSGVTNREQSHIMICKPVYDWSTKDVWTAPRKFGWDYNRAYDLMSSFGMTPHAQRVCPPFGEEPLNGIRMYAECFPGLWERMLKRVPGVASAGRWSRSPLYAFGKTPKTPPSPFDNWQEAIRGELSKWDEETGRLIAERIRREIRKHNKQTKNQPMPDCAEFGTSWSFLWMIAKRGDIKERRRQRQPNRNEVKNAT